MEVLKCALGPITVGFASSVLCIFASAEPSKTDPKLTEVWSPVPQVVAPGKGSAPPSDAIILFSKHSLSEWQHEDGSPAKWRTQGNIFTVAGGTGDLQSKRAFGDCQLHIEWRAPLPVTGQGQNRGNSGVFFQGRYEVQILDSYKNPTYSNGQAASVYKQGIPLVNASRRPGAWQAYDIIFRSPKFSEDGTVLAPAYITVIHNGVLVQDHVEVKGSTAWIGAPSYAAHGALEPLKLQDHDTKVSYRNIWIRNLQPRSQ